MLIIVRHGRTAANAGGLLLGRLDPPLDDVGVEQAAATAAAVVASSAPVRVLSSPLGRARATAEVIAQLCGAEVETDERLLELDYGDWDGRPIGDVPARDWAAWRADPGFRPPGGESLADLGARVRAACDDLAEDAAEGDVVVVSHVSPIKASVAWALRVADEVTWRMFVAPASITRIGVVADRGTVLRSFNETAHLDP